LEETPIIEYARISECCRPSYTLVIYTDGIVKKLDECSKKIGEISQSKLEELLDILKNNGFFSMNDKYHPLIKPICILMERITYINNGQTKSVEASTAGNTPDNFFRIRDEIRNVERGAKWSN